jgi:hypothetical protein
MQILLAYAKVTCYSYITETKQRSENEMKTLIRKNSVKLIAKNYLETEKVSKVALKLIELTDGKCEKTYSMQIGYAPDEVVIYFDDYYSHDIKVWLSIAKS